MPQRLQVVSGHGCVYPSVTPTVRRRSVRNTDFRQLGHLTHRNEATIHTIVTSSAYQPAPSRERPSPRSGAQIRATKYVMRTLVLTLIRLKRSHTIHHAILAECVQPSETGQESPFRTWLRYVRSYPVGGHKRWSFNRLKQSVFLGQPMMVLPRSEEIFERGLVSNLDSCAHLKFSRIEHGSAPTWTFTLTRNRCHPEMSDLGQNPPAVRR